MSSVPSIMVSSTFYDLSQIREDLREFISNELGYRALLSEHTSFPVDPDIETIENCVRRVEQDADILVLIIGGRYGSIDQKTDKSITNLEYSAARKKGIPVYTFIKKGIIDNLPLWQENPNGSFLSVTDTPRLFEFVDQIRNKEKRWTSGFETAQDIITHLRTQLALLFNESLKAKRLFSGSGIPNYMQDLGPHSLRIALEKPAAWEYLLFLNVLKDEIDHRVGMIREYKYGLQLQPTQYIPADKAATWIRTQTQHLENIVHKSDLLFKGAIQKAMGPDGTSGDPEQLVWAAQLMGRIFEHLLEWAGTVRAAILEEPFDSLSPEVALFVDDMISDIETYPKESIAKIEEALIRAKSSNDEEITVELVLAFRLSNQDRFHEAIEGIKRRFGIT